MENKITGNEPITPIQWEGDCTRTSYLNEQNEKKQIAIGLTIRQHFASLALQGLITKYNLKEPSDQDTITQMAVQLADALIIELNKSK